MKAWLCWLAADMRENGVVTNDLSPNHRGWPPAFPPYWSSADGIFIRGKTVVIGQADQEDLPTLNKALLETPDVHES